MLAYDALRQSLRARKARCEYGSTGGRLDPHYAQFLWVISPKAKRRGRLLGINSGKGRVEQRFPVLLAQIEVSKQLGRGLILDGVPAFALSCEYVLC